VPLIIESSLPEQPPPPPFYGHFSETTQVSRCQKKIFFWTFMVEGRITVADTPTIQLGATPSGQISNPSPTSPHFYAGCPSCRNPHYILALNRHQIFAGLHTQWCGFPEQVEEKTRGNVLPKVHGKWLSKTKVGRQTVTPVCAEFYQYLATLGLSGHIGALRR